MAWFVMVSWDDTPVVFGCLPWITGFGSVNVSHLFTRHPLIYSATLKEKGEVALRRLWSDLDTYPLVGTSNFSLW